MRTFILILLLVHHAACFASFEETIDVITGEWQEENEDLALPGPFGAHLIRTYSSQERVIMQFSPEWHFNLPDLFQQESPRKKVPLETYWEIKTYHDEKGRLSEVCFFSKPGYQKLHTLTCSYTESACTIHSSTGDHLTYFFKELSPQHYVIDRVEKNGAFQCGYNYCSHPIERKTLITRKTYPNGDRVDIEYALDSPMQNPSYGKVKQLNYFKNDQYAYSYYFTYHPFRTEVLHSSGIKKIYYYNADNEIEKVEDFDAFGKLHRIEETFWKNGQPICKTSGGEDGFIKSCELYAYDENDRLIKKTLAGNLSGLATEPLHVEKGHLLSHGETYSTSYEYSDQGQLLFEQEQNGKSYQYIYNERGLLKTKLLLDHQNIIYRSFFQYNDQNYLISETHDNGNSLKESDLSCVTTRQEKCYSDFHPLGMARELQERTFDLKTQQMVPLKRVFYVYTEQGDLIETRTVAQDGELLDLQRWIISTSEKQLFKQEGGKTTFCIYDLKGNLIYEKQEENGLEITYSYDQNNQLVKVEKRSPKGITTANAFIYNPMGQIIKTVDHFGNTTQFTYDAFGRQIANEVVPAFGEAPLLPLQQKTYDSFHCVVEEVDANGFSTKTRYNSRSQPIFISYPDGSEEIFSYTLNGDLQEEQNRDQTRISYTYDLLGNVLQKKVFSRSNDLVETIDYTYSGKTLVTESSSLHGTKTFGYHFSGPLNYTEELSTGHYTEKTYDSKGRLTKQSEGWFSHPQLFRQYHYDESSLTIYDQNDQLLLEIAHQNKEDAEDRLTYGSTPSGQKVLEKSSVDPQGNLLTIQYSPNELPVLEMKYDPFGNELYRKETQYDFVGNKISETYLQFNSEGMTTKWYYGPMNRIERTIENYGSSLQKSHAYEYNHFGQLSAVIKPDGVKLCYEYNDCGQVRELFSTDFTIHYVFYYDPCGNVTEVEDLIQHKSCKRTYDALNQLTSEVLANGLTIKNHYDIAGRRETLFLPDGSSVKYLYDTYFLKEVLRFNANHNLQYSYHYTQRDSKGSPTLTQMVGNLGEIYYGEKKTSLVSPFHQVTQSANRIDYAYASHQEAIHFTMDSLEQITSEFGLFAQSYTYDAFGNRQSVTHNQANQLLKDSSGTYEYDPNGNLIAWKSQENDYAYTYDALNRLCSVTNNGFEIATYTYDCFHRRMTKTFSGETHSFLYDGGYEIGAISTSGTLFELRILGETYESEAGSTVAIELEGRCYAPLHDLQGSILGIVSLETKSIEELYSFSVFGLEKIAYNSLPQNPWRYAGKRKDPETGFVFFGRRYYHPESGRWITPDPSGYVDSPNLYCYVQNNPLLKKDAFGLFSFKSLFSALAHPFATLDHLTGRIFNYLCGYSTHPVTAGVYGEGEINSKVRVSFINGMMNNEYWVLESVKALSKSHGGVNVHYVHRPTGPLFFDAMRAFMVKIGYITPHARALAEKWRELIKEMGGADAGGTILHFSHSIGSSETFAALNLLSSAEQKMIRGYSFGSPNLKSSPNCQVQHFVSVRDGICLFDLKGFIKAARGQNPTVTFVGSFWGVPLIDHYFNAKSYVDIWSAMGKTFVEWYGSLL
ncbi:putative rhs family protein [Chlamydiales bacterium STE3]|nr:putative rhs family protein [Chlamydiales bacterium STE3]